MAVLLEHALVCRDRDLALASLESFRRLALAFGADSATARRRLTAAFEGFALSRGGGWPPRSPRALAELAMGGGLPVAAEGWGRPLGRTLATTPERAGGAR